MKTIEVQAAQFFEFLKMRDASMWDIFAEMVDGAEKELVFIGENETVLFTYTLPADLEKLQHDKKLFAEQYSAQLMKNN